jgi:transcriptional regulator with XRE-family HTH domain
MMDGPTIRARREALGLSQSQLAAALDVTKDTISKWERGVLLVRHPRMLALALEALATTQHRSSEPDTNREHERPLRRTSP